MKTLHIHIGTPKTGTTAIQNFCGENRQIFESKGYCYPIFPFEFSEVPLFRNGHFLIANIFDENKKRCKNKEKQYFRDGMQEICSSFEQFDHVVISDENIWRAMDSGRKNLWKDLKKEADKAGFGIHVIVYLRRQDDFLSSLYNQRVKSAKASLSESSFEEYAGMPYQKIRLEYYTKLERMSGIIGKENVTVRRYENESFHGGDIFSDFLYTLGLPMTAEYDISQGIRNIGLYGNTLEMKRILNDLPQMEDKNSQNFIMQRLREFSEISKERYPCQMFSREEAVAFLEQYQSDNRRIAEEYLKEPGAELFDTVVKDDPKWEKENPYMTDDIIRFVGTTGIKLNQDNLELKQEISSLKQEINSMKYKLKHPFRAIFGIIKRKVVHQQI